MISAFSVMQALRAAAGFLPRAWAGAWLALIVLAVVAVLWPCLMMHVSLPWVIAAACAVLLLKLSVAGALYRLALFGKAAKAEGLSFGGLQLARPEWRLLLATLLMVAFLALIATALFIVFAIALSLSGLAAGYANSLAALSALWMQQSAAGYVVAAYVVAALLFLIVVGLRFTLMPAANIAERRLVTLNALGLSSGQTGKLSLGLGVILLPFVLVGLILLQALGARPDSLLLIYAGFCVLGVFVLLPLIVGFFASAYRQIVTIRSK